MHSALVLAAFALMILAPCLAAARRTDDTEA